MIAGAAVLAVLTTAAARGGGSCLDKPKAAALIEEASRWRKELARARAAKPRHKDLGEINGRIAALEEQLAALGCPVEWSGTRYRVRRGRRP